MCSYDYEKRQDDGSGFAELRLHEEGRIAAAGEDKYEEQNKRV
jgi:hypothetical protein